MRRVDRILGICRWEVATATDIWFGISFKQLRRFDRIATLIERDTADFVNHMAEPAITRVSRVKPILVPVLVDLLECAIKSVRIREPCIGWQVFKLTSAESEFIWCIRLAELS